MKSLAQEVLDLCEDSIVTLDDTNAFVCQGLDSIWQINKRVPNEELMKIHDKLLKIQNEIVTLLDKESI